MLAGSQDILCESEPMQLSANDLIDLETYPISTPGPARDAILAIVREALDLRGCAAVSYTHLTLPTKCSV